jgi:hypothetical protein
MPKELSELEQLRARVKTLERHKSALLEYSITYAWCLRDCKFGKKKDNGEPEPCTCGWLKAHEELGRILYNLKD